MVQSLIYLEEGMVYAYAVIDPDTKTITQFYEDHPNWLDDNGNPLTDEMLKEHFVFKVDYESKKPEYDEFSQKLIENKISDWIIDFDSGIVYVTYKVIDIPLEEKKQEIAGLIRQSFINEFKYGTFKSTLGFVVDCRRYDIYNDIQNLSGLIELVEQAGLNTVSWKDASGTMHNLTLEQAKQLLKEMGFKILWNYQHKWEKLAELDKITDYENLKTFAIWEPDKFYDYLSQQLSST